MNTDQFTAADWFGVFLAFGGILFILSALAVALIAALDRWN